MFLNDFGIKFSADYPFFRFNIEKYEKISPTFNSFGFYTEQVFIELFEMAIYINIKAFTKKNWSDVLSCQKTWCNMYVQKIKIKPPG